MRYALAAVLILISVRSVQADDPLVEQVRFNMAGTTESPKPQDPEAVPAEAIQEFSVGPRLTMLGGKAFSGSDWSDFFGNGVGVEAKYAYLWNVDDGVWLGPYVGGSFSSFSGEKSNATIAATAFTVEPDDMKEIRAVVGAESRQDLGGGLFVGEHAGIGPVFYQTVDATFSTGTTSASLRVVDSSVALTFEAGINLGAAIGDDIDLLVGVGFESDGAPDASKNLGGIDIKKQSNVVGTVALNVRF